MGSAAPSRTSEAGTAVTESPPSRARTALRPLSSLGSTPRLRRCVSSVQTPARRLARSPSLLLRAQLPFDEVDQPAGERRANIGALACELHHRLQVAQWHAGVVARTAEHDAV